MAKYLLLKHYRGAPAAVNDVPMDRWTPGEIDAHVAYMQDFATRLEKSGELLDGGGVGPAGETDEESTSGAQHVSSVERSGRREARHGKKARERFFDRRRFAGATRGTHWRDDR